VVNGFHDPVIVLNPTDVVARQARRRSRRLGDLRQELGAGFYGEARLQGNAGGGGEGDVGAGGYSSPGDNGIRLVRTGSDGIIVQFQDTGKGGLAQLGPGGVVEPLDYPAVVEGDGLGQIRPPSIPPKGGRNVAFSSPFGGGREGAAIVGFVANCAGVGWMQAVLVGVDVAQAQRTLERLFVVRQTTDCGHTSASGEKGISKVIPS